MGYGLWEMHGPCLSTAEGKATLCLFHTHLDPPLVPQ